MIALDNKYSKLLFLVLLCLFCGGILVFLATAIAPYLFDINSFELSKLVQSEEVTGSTSTLKFIQLFNGLGLFIIPAFLYFFLIEKNGLKQKFGQSFKPESMLLVILIFFSFYPLIGFLGKWNAALDLPDYLSYIEDWMKSAEEHAEKLTTAFLQMESPLDLGINLFLIAIMPALGEELIFRGIVQPTINEGNQNKHWGVWISAILFSAIHMQFYGFIPRMLLGALFGYIYLWSKNLWLPIFAHFLNNGLAVLLTYWMGIEALKTNREPMDYGQSFPLLILSLLLMTGLLFLFRKYHLPKTKDT